MIFIKVLDRNNRPAANKAVKISSTGMKGSTSRSTAVVQFNIEPGEYQVYISGTYIVTQYLSETNNTFHVR